MKWFQFAQVLCTPFATYLVLKTLEMHKLILAHGCRPCLQIRVSSLFGLSTSNCHSLSTFAKSQYIGHEQSKAMHNFAKPPKSLHGSTWPAMKIKTHKIQKAKLLQVITSTNDMNQNFLNPQSIQILSLSFCSCVAPFLSNFPTPRRSRQWT